MIFRKINPNQISFNCIIINVNQLNPCKSACYFLGIMNLSEPDGNKILSRWRELNPNQISFNCIIISVNQLNPCKSACYFLVIF